MKILAYTLLLFIALTSCDHKKETYKFNKKLNSGIAFQNTLTITPELNILNYLYYYNGAGVASGDFNNDGLDDIYFTGNQTADALYLNKGDLNFKDITAQSNISNDSGWTTGVTTLDINSDGLLDIYISKVSGHLHLTGSNLLFVNQGIKDGIPLFKEESSKYHLNLSGLFTQASFFDYDLDGDLDAYILGHSLYPNSYYGRGSQRKNRDSINGDKLLENRNGVFYDVSAKANIFSSRIGYGLGIATSDLNNDGYPDIYIGNDFFENDYLYINQKDGTFKEVNTTQGILGHTSHFSMGNDIADINNDGLTDIISVDMLPEEIQTLKTSGAEFNYPIFQNNLKGGYESQFMQNTLHINQGNNHFTETAFLSNIAATEWSWSPLLADFDNDGDKDIYITNGILGATNDMDFINFISNENIQKRLFKGMKAEDLSFIDEMPKKRTVNYFFENKGDLTFTNTSNSWIEPQPSYSNGSTYSDLDNDGDLDIIVNNVNEPAFILENTSSNTSDSLHYLHIKFKGKGLNTYGIGAKIITSSPSSQQFFENYTTRGFLSATSPSINIGLGKNKKLDSLKVVWTDGSYQDLYNINVDQIITLNQNNASGNYYSRNQQLLIKTNDSLISFKHKDNSTPEFSRNPLIPYASTNLSKTIAVGDLNNDNLQDVIGLGAKGIETLLYYQEPNGSFTPTQLPNQSSFLLNEDIDAIVFNANGDSYNDVLIVSGGNEINKGKPLTPRLYINSKSGFKFKQTAFKNIEANASTVRAIDLDNDGDLDITITSDAVPQQFGVTPNQYILFNDGKGNFKDVSDSYGRFFKTIGNVRDVIWQDVDNNGYKDAFVVGHWMSPTLFLNNGKELILQNNNGLENSKGWYNSIKSADFDNDGDIDLIAGNWGLNSRLNATSKEPLQLYIQDFDDNGKLDPIVTYYYQGEQTTIATKDELVKQLPQLNKKYLSYAAFAKAKFKDLLPKDKLESAQIKSVTELGSMYFENNGDNTFTPHQLPLLSQISSVHDILIDDVNKDGYLDAILVGNEYEISTQIGRLDGSHGTILINDKKGFFNVQNRVEMNILGAARTIQPITVSGFNYYIIGRNNDTPLFIRKDN